MRACRHGALVQRWDSDDQWTKQGVIAAVCGPQGSMLLLTAPRVLFWVRYEGDRAGLVAQHTLKVRPPGSDLVHEGPLPLLWHLLV